MINVVNFFKFLEDKIGRKVPLQATLKFAPETVTVKDYEHVEGKLDMHALEQYPKDLVIKRVTGPLNLSHVKELPNNFSPIVGGDLNLNSLQKVPQGFNPTVGGFLWLYGLREVPDDFNPTVVGNLVIANVKLGMNNKQLRKRFPKVKGLTITAD